MIYDNYVYIVGTINNLAFTCENLASLRHHSATCIQSE